MEFVSMFVLRSNVVKYCDGNLSLLKKTFIFRVLFILVQRLESEKTFNK